MAITAGRSATLTVCATVNGSYQTVGNLQSIDPSGLWSPEFWETTMMGDAATRMASSGFYKNSIAISGMLNTTDAGQAILIAAFGGTPIFCKLTYNGTNGKAFSCVVKDVKIGGKAGADASPFSCTLENADGVAPTALP